MLGRIEIAAQDSPLSGKDWKRILPGLLVSLLALAAVFTFANIGQMLQALRLADYRLVLAALLLSVVWLGVRAVFWRTLLQEKATFDQVFFTITEGYLLNNVLPFRLGEVARAFLLSQKARLEFWEVLSSILIERIFDLGLAAALLFGTLAFVVGADWAHQAALGAGALVLVGLLALFLAARYRERTLSLFKKISARWPLIDRLAGSRLPAFMAGLAVLTDGDLFLKAVFWVLLDWLIAIFQYYLLLLAFLPDAKFLWAAFSLGVAALGIAAPSSPGALGVLEISIIGALALFKVDPSVALAFALTAHLFNYVVNGAIGAYALARDGESLGGLYRQVRRISSRGAPEIPPEEPPSEAPEETR